MAKKKGSSKRRRSAPPGVDPNEKRRERLEARRRAKAEAIAAQQRAERRARILRLLVYGAIFALAVWFFFLRGSGVPEEIADRVQSFGTAGENDHAGQGETVTYETSPPVSGRHAPNPYPCGTYAEPVPNENLVHSLEHGAVYLLYAPDLPVEQIRTLEEIAAGRDENVLSAPYEGEMERLVAVGSWGERMDLDEVDEDLIRIYIDTFAGEGPESDTGQTCPNERDDEFEPADEEAAPGTEVTPGTELTPGSTPSAKDSKKKS